MMAANCSNLCQQTYKSSVVKTFSVVDSPSNVRPMLRLVLPALAEEFLVLMVTWTDWWLAGHYFQHAGDATKAAMGLMGYVMWLIPSLFAAIAIGATAIIARSVGRGEFTSASRTANQAYLLGIFLASIFTIFAMFGGHKFIELMQLRDDAADYANEYFDIILWFIPFVMCTQVGAACLRGAGDTLTGSLAKSIVVFVNILVSTSLVTGWGPFPAIGWKGIAIGTATGHAIGGLIVVSVLIFGRAGLQLKLSQMVPDFKAIWKLMRIGLPGGFDFGTLLFSQLIFLAMINSLGKASAAAHGLAVQIEACCFLPGAAFQVAAATMAGQFLGAKLPHRATRSAQLCLGAGLIIMTTAGLLFYFFGFWFALFFTGDINDPTTARVADLLKIVAIATPSIGFLMILSGTLRGAGDTVWPFFFTAIGFFVIRIPLAALFAFETFEVPILETTVSGMGWGIEGAWYAMVIDLLIRSIMVTWRFLQGGWKRIKI